MMKNDDILDELPSRKKKRISTFKDFVPVYAVGIYLLFSLLQNVLFLNFSIENLMAYILTALFVGVYFVNRKAYIFGLFLLFVTSMFALVNYSLRQETITLIIGPIQLMFQPHGMAFLIMHLLVFYNEVPFLKNKPKEMVQLKSGKKIEKVPDAQLDKLKRNFANKSTDDLQKIIASKDYRDAAKLAAEQLLENRKEK